MSKKTESDHQYTLDRETLQLLGSAPQAFAIPTDRLTTMRARLMARIDQDDTPKSAEYVTLRTNEGSWSKIAPKIEKKILYIDEESNTESYLLRIHPGAESASHFHQHDEHCLILAGDVKLGEIQLQVGDYHLAKKGSRHGIGSSVAGALLFIHTGVDTNPSKA